MNKKRIRYYVFLLLVTPICLEIALRILGYSPYQQLQYSIESSPKMCVVASKEYGFALGEGTFEVSVNGAPNYVATHRNGKRISRLGSANDSLEKVFLMGCSFTYGMGVDDSLSFPFKVQNHFKDLSIQNFGVPGFGTIQSYLQLKKELKNGRIPAVVIVNFCDFHNERNSLTPRFRNSLVMGYQRSNDEISAELKKSKFPFIENGEVKTVAFKDLYSNWTGRETFATINYFQTLNDERLTGKIDQKKNTEIVFEKIKKLCDEHKIRLIVTGLTRGLELTSFLHQIEQQGIEVHDISLDLSSKKYNQLPYDSHPNAAAHDYFSKKIIDLLSQ